jgi:hypothetical protein
VALTDKEKHKTIFYLGWSGLTIVEDSTQFNSVVRDRLGTTLKPLNLQIEKKVKELLEQLEALDESLEAARCRLSASRVDSITMNPDEIKWLRSERRRYIRELSDHLDIPIMKSGGVNMSVVV